NMPSAHSDLPPFPTRRSSDLPAYMLKFAETQRIEAVLTYHIEMPKLVAQEWIVFAARPPELPGQVRVTTTLEPGGKPAFELSAEDRKSTRLNSSHQIISYAVF